jgi:hypothetical protein
VTRAFSSFLVVIERELNDFLRKMIKSIGMENSFAEIRGNLELFTSVINSFFPKFIPFCNESSKQAEFLVFRDFFVENAEKSYY